MSEVKKFNHLSHVFVEVCWLNLPDLPCYAKGGLSMRGMTHQRSELQRFGHFTLSVDAFKQFTLK